MAMIQCKECKQEVSSKAKTCPHCGIADPALTTAGKLTGCGIIIVLFLGIAFGIGSCMFDAPRETASTAQTIPAESTAVSQVPAPAEEERKSLGVSPNAYANRINALLKKLERPYRVDPAQIVKGDVNDVLNSKLGKYTTLVAIVSKKGEIIDVTVIGGGDGTPASGLEIMMLASAALTAAAPGAEFKEVFTGLPELMNGKTMTYGDVKLSAKRSEELGNWFFAEPI
jgi:hypothetical protein